MGFTVDYRSTRAVTAAEAEAIDLAASRLCEDPEWVGCEPILFSECLDAIIADGAYPEGHLSGFSKLSLKEAQELVKEEQQLAIPGVEIRIATIHDLIDALCQISRDHQIDWEISHEYHDGPAGYIRSGVADDKLVAEIDRASAEIEEARKIRNLRHK